MADRIATCELCGCSWSHSGTRGRLPKRCPDCHRTHWNDWQREKHRDVYRRPCRVAKCVDCHRFIGIFTRSGRLPSRCDSCGLAYMRRKEAAKRKRNATAIRAAQRRFSERHPDRVRRNSALQAAKRRAAPAFLVTRKEVARLMAAPCLYCGAPSDHIDHIIPVSRGGVHSIGNLTGACAKCNQSKSNKLLVEWRLQRKENNHAVPRHDARIAVRRSPRP